MKALVFPEDPKIRDLANKYHYEPWLVARFVQYVPDAVSFLEKMERLPTRYIRVNTIKTTPDELIPRLQEKGFCVLATFLPEVFSVSDGSVSIGATTEYMLGHYYIQDLSSCIAVEALDLSANHLALDVAAAPGGKTTLMAQKMNNTGCIVAFEPNEKRVRAMSFNLARMGASNVCVRAADGAEAAILGPIFDRVLLDAPCSCEGVIAKDPSRKTSHTIEDVEFCSNRQLGLIDAAISAVKPGGVLVYSTCSFAPEENEAIVSHALEKYEELQVEPVQFGVQGMTEFGNQNFNPKVRNTRRFYPHINDTTGFFIAKLRRAG